MKFVLFLTLICFAVAIYLFLCVLFHVPSLASTKAVLMLTRSKKVKGYHAAVMKLATQLSKHIHLSPYKRREMTATLKYAKIELSPETYYAQIIVNSALCLVPAIPCIFIFPLAIFAFVFLAIRRLKKGIGEARKIVNLKRERIDKELLRFVQTIMKEIEVSHDVLNILEGYRNSASDLFRDELEITIAEMKSGSQEQALNNLSSRVGSAKLRQVVEGLLGVIRGGDEVLYFNMLAYDLKNSANQQMEKEILKRPGEMQKYFYLMLGAFIVNYGYVFLIYSMSSFNNLT